MPLKPANFLKVFFLIVFGTCSFSSKQEQLRQKYHTYLLYRKLVITKKNFKNLNADKKRNVTFLETFLLKDESFYILFLALTV